ncbi:MAG: tetratricopeptide repeat protein [Candidatus Aminicenantes bacterium]|nr:tetratricopeptide repeat protein [Candidatus Aminicenantes bacterium]
MKRRIWILAIVYLVSLPVLAEKTIDQKQQDLEKILKSTSGKEKIEILNRLAYSIYEQYPNKCIEYSEEAIQLSREMNHQQGEGIALKNMGMGNLELGDNENSFKNSRKALKIFEKIGDKKNIADSLTSIASIYLNLSQYDRALDNFLKSLKMSEEIEYKKGIKNNLNNIGVIHFFRGNDDKALEYFKKTLQIDKEFEDKRGIADCFNNIAMVYNKFEKHDQAVSYYLKAAKMYAELADKAGLANTWMNLGTTYALLKDYKKSEEYLKRSFNMASELDLRIQIIRTSINLGEFYSMQKKYNPALIYLQKALKVAKEFNLKELTWSASYNLSEVYAGRGDYKKALEYHRLAFEVYQEIYNEEKNKLITEMETRYNTLEKEKRIEILEKNNQIQKLQLSKERVTRNAFIFGFILVIIILVLLFKKYLYLFSFWKKQKFIGQYRLLDKIGSGGMGNIYKAHSIRDKSKKIAIKILREELFGEESNRRRFEREAKIIDKLNHPNIIKIIERGQQKQRLFIAMELLEGQTLDARIREQGKIQVKECLHISLQIAGALIKIHGENIVHRDLKPANIMVIQKNNRPDFVKLLDFGLAKMKFETTITESGIVIGTINYIPPEQLSGDEFSAPGDIYSLGAIMYEMVTGKKTFHGESSTDIMRQILDTSPIQPHMFTPGIPPELNRLIMQMLAKHTPRRPTIGAVVEKLDEIRLNISRENV